jgi:hypothetical protein
LPRPADAFVLSVAPANAQVVPVSRLKPFDVTDPPAQLPPEVLSATMVLVIVRVASLSR